MPEKSSRSAANWHDMASDVWALAVDSVAVVWLRLGRLAMLDAQAGAELRRIVDEKAAAALELNMRALRGDFGTTQLSIAHGTVRHFGKKVAANRRRLSGAPPR